MTQLICDKCGNPIHARFYYTIHTHESKDSAFSDSEKDICPRCARLYSVDGALMAGKELKFEESEVAK